MKQHQYSFRLEMIPRVGGWRLEISASNCFNYLPLTSRFIPMNWRANQSLTASASGSRPLTCTEGRNQRRISRTTTVWWEGSRGRSRSTNCRSLKIWTTTPSWAMILDKDFSKVGTFYFLPWIKNFLGNVRFAIQ